MKNKISRFILLFATVSLLSNSSLATAYQSETKAKGNNLSGVILDEKENPIEGARVWVYTARPRKGRGFL